MWGGVGGGFCLVARMAEEPTSLKWRSRHISEDGRVVKAKVLRSFGAIRVGSIPTPRILVV